MRNRTSACTRLLLDAGVFACCACYFAVRCPAQSPAAPNVENHASHSGMPGMKMEGESGPASQPSTSAPASLPDHTAIRIPREVQQQIGVRVGRVEEGSLAMTVRTVGILQPNETKVARIHLKTEGWVEKLFVSFTGQEVKKGDPLLSIYSPQFFIAQQEYLTALAAAASGQSAIPGESALLESSRQKLELLDVPPEEIDELKNRKTPMKTLMLRSLIGGTVLEKKAFEGQYVTPKDELYVVADLSTIWVQAKVYEYELPHVELGRPATVTLPSMPNRVFTGKVVFIDPVVEEPARTANVRVELPNPDGLLKPGMFSYVVISHQMGTGLLVPTEAVIRTGRRDIAFRVEEDDLFVPVAVRISPIQFGDAFQVLEGLHAGERVCVSANFLIDSESRLQAGSGGMAGMAGMPGMEMNGRKKPAQSMPGMQHH